MILWLLGCPELESYQVLPVQLAMMVELRDGSVRSLLVELGRVYEHQLDVREAEGPLLYDGRHLWQWQEGQLRDLLSKKQLSLLQSKEEFVPIKERNLNCAKLASSLECSLQG